MGLTSAYPGLFIGNTSLPNVQEIVLYPVAEILAATEVADTGSSPVYIPTVAASTTVITEATPGVAWTEDFAFEQSGVVTILGVYIEFEWQTRFVAGTGNSTASVSKIQMSTNGGTSWTDITDDYTNAAVSMTSRIRAGVGRWLTSISLGSTPLRFRLAHWLNGTVAGTAASEAQIRSNSYVRLQYIKR